MTCATPASKRSAACTRSLRHRERDLSLSYHNVGGGVHESAYAWKDSELVHSSILDIRKSESFRSNRLKDPKLPFTPFNLPGHTSALGNL